MGVGGIVSYKGKWDQEMRFFFMMRECLYGTGEKAESDNAGE